MTFVQRYALTNLNVYPLKFAFKNLKVQYVGGREREDSAKQEIAEAERERDRAARAAEAASLLTVSCLLVEYA